MTTISRDIEIRQATHHGVVPFYQPILNLENPGELCYEVLGRLNVGGVLLAPGEFLPSLERTPFMAKFDRAILTQAIKQAGIWAYEEDRDVHLHVNASAQALVQPGYSTLVRELLQQHRVSPEFVTIEVIETCTFWKSPATLRTLKELRHLGVCIAIDDFPCWEDPQALLGWLSTNPGRVQTLKLDRSLVVAACGYDLQGNKLHEVVAAQHLTELLSYVEFAKKLGLSVVAEGIENNEQMVTMQLCGIVHLQGYGIGKPKAVTELDRSQGIIHSVVANNSNTSSLAKM